MSVQYTYLLFIAYCFVFGLDDAYIPYIFQFSFFFFFLFEHRMGSFNSAPKINNTDSQDDVLEMPNGLACATDLVNYCKLMRGESRPELLQRSFFKPIGDQTGTDLTDGMRYLQLNSVSKGLLRICTTLIKTT